MYNSKLDNSSSEELISVYYKLYTEKFGSNKYDAIFKKVHASNRISKLIHTLTRQKLSPSKDGFLVNITAIPYFFFSGGETVCLATLFALDKCLEEGIKNNYSLNEDTIKEVVITAILKSIKMNINSTFFDDYFNLIEERNQFQTSHTVNIDIVNFIRIYLIIYSNLRENNQDRKHGFQHTIKYFVESNGIKNMELNSDVMFHFAIDPFMLIWVLICETPAFFEFINVSNANFKIVAKESYEIACNVAKNDILFYESDYEESAYEYVKYKNHFFYISQLNDNKIETEYKTIVYSLEHKGYNIYIDANFSNAKERFEHLTQKYGSYSHNIWTSEMNINRTVFVLLSNNYKFKSNINDSVLQYGGHLRYTGIDEGIY